MDDERDLVDQSLFTVAEESARQRISRDAGRAGTVLAVLVYAVVCWRLVGPWFAMLFLGVPGLLLGVALLASGRTGQRRRSSLVGATMVAASALLTMGGAGAVARGLSAQLDGGEIVAAPPSITPSSHRTVTHLLTPSPTDPADPETPSESPDVGADTLDQPGGTVTAGGGGVITVPQDGAAPVPAETAAAEIPPQVPDEAPVNPADPVDPAPGEVPAGPQPTDQSGPTETSSDPTEQASDTTEPTQ